jgi:hypothetical protein
MSDLRTLSRSIEIHLSDESTIDLDINIAISTEASGCIANDRIQAEKLAKTTEVIQVMLIAVLEKTDEELMEMAQEHGT